MEDYIKDLAAAEGWTDATTAIVLAGVLQQLVDMGAAEAGDLKALIRRRGGVGEGMGGDMPSPGDDVEMEGVDATIEIADVPDEQPEADAGIFAIVDQYGETHRVERGGDDGWVVVIPAI